MDSLRIHCFQHVPFEGLGCINDWIVRYNHRLTYTKFYENPQLPVVSDLDWLIVMGGPMGVDDERVYPWLKWEKKFIKEAIDSGKTVLGICLGAQLVANVLGAKVYSNPEKEIGWMPVNLTVEGKENSLFDGFEESFNVFHWHGDTFELPEGTVHLAFSEGCRNQAFLYKQHVLGLQFHFEATAHSLTEMVEHGKSELIPAKYVQMAEQIIQGQHWIKEGNNMMFKILDVMAQRYTLLYP